MRNLLHVFLSICLLGLFLSPAQTFACSAHAVEVAPVEMFCCEHSEAEKLTDDTDEEECCEDLDNEGAGCSSGCNMKSCHQSSHTFCMQIIGKQGLNMFHYGLKKSYPSYQQSYFPSGIPSIWQPPKIG